MDMNLQSLSSVCCVSGRAFEDGQRVASYLVRRDPEAQAQAEKAATAAAAAETTATSAANVADAANAANVASAANVADANVASEVARYDLLETEVAGFVPAGRVICRWVQVFRPRKQADNPERELKLTAESLFLSLADPSNANPDGDVIGMTEEEAANNTRMTQVLALMLERKRVLRPKGTSADGQRTIYEHAKSKQIYEIPRVTDLSPEFFLSIQEQLAALVGSRHSPA